MTGSIEQIVLLSGCEHSTRVCLENTVRSLGFAAKLAENGQVRSWLEESGRDIAALIVEPIIPVQQVYETFNGIREKNPHLPIIMVVANPSAEHMMSAIRSGATDFLSKPLSHDSIVNVLTRALGNLPSTGHRDSSIFVGGNSQMKEIYALLPQIAQSQAPVLIQGETGSGKEVLARELHNRSLRAGRPFLKLNCAALPSELVESELFGYERGAFTGAFKRKEGMFDLADGGTLLLDEIGDMDLRPQAKLLQVLQDREFRRIGGKEIVKVDVRIMAASHRDLEHAVQDRRFREDLYYRLNVVNLVVPPLRDRKEDLMSMAQLLINRHLGGATPAPELTVELRQAMIAYHWPGNVRELENYIRKLIIFRDCSSLARELRARTAKKQTFQPANSLRTAPEVYSGDSVSGISALELVVKVKEEAETTAIIAALNSTHWNRKRAAAILNIDYKSLLYRMKKLSIGNKSSAKAAQAPTIPQNVNGSPVAGGPPSKAGPLPSVRRSNQNNVH